MGTVGFQVNISVIPYQTRSYHKQNAPKLPPFVIELKVEECNNKKMTE